MIEYTISVLIQGTRVRYCAKGYSAAYRLFRKYEELAAGRIGSSVEWTDDKGNVVRQFSPQL